MTIKEIAKLAGVSTATVSRTLNGGVVKDKTKERIERVIEEHNYIPNSIAKQMHQKRVNRILVVLPSISNPFYSHIFKGFSDVFSIHNINIMFIERLPELDTDDEYLKLIKNQTVDGVIIMSKFKNEDVLKVLQDNVDYPIIQCSEFNDGLSIPYVSIDDEKACFDACELLINKGCTKLYFVAGYREYNFVKKRMNGFISAIKQTNPNLKYDIIDAELDYNGGYNSLSKMDFTTSDKIGVLIISDLAAYGLVNSALDNNISIPNKLSIIGFDNIEFTNYFRPKLTVVAQPIYELGEQTALRMIDMIEKKSVESILLEYKIIEGETT